ncbi:MAG: hypothetical protein KA972_01390 [Brachymonas sp.]|nr:hypothetical protein [Brachymonas sp.]
MLLFFSVARSAQAGQAERAKQAVVAEAQEAEEAFEPEEKMPTDKIVDVTPLALRMSSPFNAQYWLSAVNDSDNNMAATA